MQGTAKEYKKTEQGVQNELQIAERYLEYLAGSDVGRIT